METSEPNMIKELALTIPPTSYSTLPQPGVPARGAQQYKHRRGDQEGRRQRLRADGDQPEQHQVHLGREVGEPVQVAGRELKRGISLRGQLQPHRPNLQLTLQLS